jgi:hypothetical protein
MTFKVLVYILKACFFGLFRVGNSRQRTAGIELIRKPTFRLPDYAAKDRLIGLRQFKRSWSAIYSCGMQNKEKHSGILIFETSVKSIAKRAEYLIWEKKYKSEDLIGVARPELYQFSKTLKVKLGLILLAFFIFPCTIFSRYRVQWALLFSEYVEIVGLLNFVDRNEFNKIHFFNVAEKDANLIYLLLSIRKVQVVKHPSPGALIAHNKNLMTDVLAFSSKYQEEEYQLTLKDSIVTSETEVWAPENAVEYDAFYLNKPKPNIYPYKLGFYSHGGWLRQEKKATNALFAKPEDEYKVLEILSVYLKDNPKQKMIIFLHPKEKLFLEKAKLFYGKYFNLDKVDFYLGQKSSSSFFNEVEYGLGAYSTVLFERDNYGFKTIVWRDGEAFPVKGSKMHENSFSNLNELDQLVLK